MIIAFDVTSEKSFNSVRGWISSIFKAIGENSIPLVLVGNKIDLEKVVQKTDIDKMTNEMSLNYHETSAMTGQGVNEMIQDIMKQAYVFKFGETADSTAVSAAASTNDQSRPSDN